MTKNEAGSDYKMLVDGLQKIQTIGNERKSLALALGCECTPIVEQLNGFWGHYATLLELFTALRCIQMFAVL